MLSLRLFSRRRTRLAAGIAAVFALAAAALPAWGPFHGPLQAGGDQVGTGTVLPLQEFANDGAGGRTWNAYDQTENAQGPMVTGRPSPLISGANVQVFARAAGGDLTEFANDDANGRLWNSYDRTQASGGPTVVGDPSALQLGSNQVGVFAQGSGGDLVEFANDGLNGHAWNSYDISKLTQTQGVVGDPAAVLSGSTIEVFGRASNGHLLLFSAANTVDPLWSVADVTEVAQGQQIAGDPEAVRYGASQIHVYAISGPGHLVEFVNDAVGGNAWNSYDLTNGSSGPVVTGRPSAVAYGSTIHVYVRAGSGDLTEFVNDAVGHRLWNAYDLTNASGGPQVQGDPSAVLYGQSSIHIYAQSSQSHLVEFVNDGAWGRLWNAYDQTQTAQGIEVGGDPAAGVYGASVHVYVAGPPPPQIVAQIVALAEGADQYNGAVVENPPGSNCNRYSAYFGRGSSSGCAAGLRAEEWCSDFAQWVWTKSGIDTTGINGWAYTFVSWGQSHTGAWKPGTSNSPQPGDVVVWGNVAQSYAIHAGIVVGVSLGQIDVVSGNSGPVIDAAGDVDAVWDSGYFDPTTSTISGYPIIGYVSPTGWSQISAHVSAQAPVSNPTSTQIATQDGGH